jgi:hypothetical protein
LKNVRRVRIFNPLTYKYLVRGAGGALVAALVACGGAARSASDQAPVPAPTLPLPTAGLAGQRVGLFPLTLIAAEDSLRWDNLIRDRRPSLSHADSVIAELLSARAPEVSWILPAALRSAARRAVGIATEPDHMGTSVLRDERLEVVPDPLRTQLRSLSGIAGGRFAVIPAALLYKRRVVGRMPGKNEATAELVMVMVDVRTARVVWRTTARGLGEDPWTSLTSAVKALTPGLP